MPISVNPVTHVISIPKTYLTLVSGTLYGLNTDTLRKDLRTWEATEEGRTEPRTHDHNTEYTVSGVTYARKVEIINGYKIEFEDGAYSVILSGSNNNVFDIQGNILVQNQVQVIPQNSAGLQTVNTGGTTPALTAQNISDLTDAIWAGLEGSHNAPGSMGEQLHIAALAYMAALSLH